MWAFIFNMYYLHVKISQFSQKTSASQTHFGFTNIGSGMPTFRDTANWKSKFWFGSPCRVDLTKFFMGDSEFFIFPHCCVIGSRVNSRDFYTIHNFRRIDSFNFIWFLYYFPVIFSGIVWQCVVFFPKELSTKMTSRKYITFFRQTNIFHRCKGPNVK